MSNLLAKLLTRSFPGKPADAFPVLNPSVDGQAEGNESDDVRGYESRAFSIWLDELLKLGARKLIDFGPMRSQSVTFFGQYQLGLSILGLTAEADPIPQLLSFEPDARYDAALCWEYPNYLQTTGLRAMGEWLAEHIRPGGVVLVSLATKSPYPDLPSTYVAVDPTHLDRELASAPSNRTQRYSSGELAKHWPEFEPIRSFLLRTGMQEFVLRRRAD